MNHLASVKKIMSCLEVAYGRIATEGTRQKAKDEISAGCARMGLGFFPMVGPDTVNVVPSLSLRLPEDGKPEWVAAFAPEIPSMSVSVLVAGANQGGEALPAGLREDAPKAKETGFVDEGELGPGVMTEVVGDLTPAETDLPVVELIGGWPKVAEIEVTGLAPNRRMLKGRLVSDGRSVSMERTMKAWKVMDRVSAKLMRAGGSPLYRVA